MSKKNKKKLSPQPVEPPKDQVRCCKCGHIGPKDELAVFGVNERTVSNWRSTPVDRCQPGMDPKPVCNECAERFQEEFQAQFTWWFKHHPRLPFLAKTLEVAAQVRHLPPKVIVPRPSDQEKPRQNKIHPLDVIMAKAQINSPDNEIETQASEDHRVTCSICGCEGMEDDQVEIDKYGNKSAKWRCTPLDRNHPEVQSKPVCLKCANKQDAKFREEYGWWFNNHRYLPPFAMNKSIMAKHQAERQKDLDEQDAKMKEFARRYNVVEDPNRICSRCGNHHGQVSIVSQRPCRKRMTMVGWVLVNPETEEELRKNACCSDCLGTDEKAHKYHEVIKTLGKNSQAPKIDSRFLPKKVREGEIPGYGSAFRATTG